MEPLYSTISVQGLGHNIISPAPHNVPSKRLNLNLTPVEADAASEAAGASSSSSSGLSAEAPTPGAGAASASPGLALPATPASLPLFDSYDKISEALVEPLGLLGIELHNDVPLFTKVRSSLLDSL